MNDIPIAITEAFVADAAVILALQKLAFASEAALHDDDRLPPLQDALDDFRERFADHVFLKAMSGGEVVGSVRARMVEGTCHVGRLIVHPASQGKGIGTALMRAIEARFSQARRFEIFTGHKSVRTIGLYERRGYRELRRVPVSAKVTLVFMEKHPSRDGV